LKVRDKNHQKDATKFENKKHFEYKWHYKFIMQAVQFQRLTHRHQEGNPQIHTQIILPCNNQLLHYCCGTLMNSMEPPKGLINVHRQLAPSS
jgi:hypothetical protein